MRTVLVAGATGHLGAHVLSQLDALGYRTRALVRDPARARRLRTPPHEVVTGDLLRPASLRGACDGADALVSCAGASMRLGGLGDRASFGAVDDRGNRALLDEAVRAGVRKVVYVSVFGAAELAHTEYVAAHERFVGALDRSGIAHAVVRPTGYFSVFAEFLAMARRGRAMLIGDGEVRTNPVHEADVAAACVASLRDDRREIPIGGPDVLTRRRIAELAFEALGRAPRITSVPPSLFSAINALVAPINPRLHVLVEFGVEVSRRDMIAPAVGERRLEAHFAELAH